MRALWVTLMILVAVGAATLVGGYVWYDQAIHAGGSAGPKVEFEVPKGASVKKVGQLLVQEGLIREPLALQVWFRAQAGIPEPKAGRHLIDPGSSIPELFATLAEKPLPEDVPVTLVEGWRLSDADAFLTEAGRIEAGDYLEATKAAAGYEVPFPVEGDGLAGYLLPETYMVPPGKVDARALVQRQLEAFHAQFYQPHKEELDKSDRSLREIVILASLLEREEPDPSVRPKVAGVLYNRLEKGDPLGVDATSRYTLKDWSDRRAFLRKLRDPKDPWNTRLKAGLPPGPIGAPSLPSLIAALRPERSKYWYYLHDKMGRIHFSKTAAEHEAKRRKYDIW